LILLAALDFRRRQVRSDASAFAARVLLLLPGKNRGQMDRTSQVKKKKQKLAAERTVTN
jgi:hypothetical protein